MKKTSKSQKKNIHLHPSKKRYEFLKRLRLVFLSFLYPVDKLGKEVKNKRILNK
jgi:hypothetical protein